MIMLPDFGEFRKPVQNHSLVNVVFSPPLNEFPEHVKVFQAGTALTHSDIVTAGGRVLCVCALGATVAEAQHEAYLACGQIDWPGAFTRSDIGYRGLAREQKQ